jgi:phospho-N-acetylmuramoyl-pentapeptide-transferase
LFAWLAHDFAHTSTHLSFTRPLTTISARSDGSCFAILVVYATANAVNLTDGLDGLAAGSSAFVFAAFMIIAFTEFRHDTLYGIQRAQALDQAIVRPRMFGACTGFLWWNAAPARIIMGDTGSLAIGGRWRARAAHAHHCCCRFSRACR